MPRLEREGVGLSYEEVGQGTPPFLLIHGGGCDHTFFAPQIAHYRERHRVIAVDLRGHGLSDKPRQDYTFAGLTDDVAWLCDRLEVRQPIVIGHSMGGAIAVNLAARRPDLAAAIVVLDFPIGTPGPELGALFQPLLDGLRTPAYREVLREFFTPHFASIDDADQKARLLDVLLSVPQHVMTSVIENLATFDGAAALAACRVPALYVGAVLPTDLARARELCPQLVVGQTIGSGHYHQVEVPDQVNAMIDRFLALSGLGRRPPASREESNKAAVRRVFDEAWNRGNLAVVDELVHPKFVDHGWGPDTSGGPEGYKQLIQRWRRAFPDLHFAIEDLIAEGDRVAFRVTVTGTHRRTGKAVVQTMMSFARLTDGQGVEGWTELDQLKLREQIGT